MSKEPIDAVGGFRVEIADGTAIERQERVDGETGEVTRKAHKVQLCYLHHPSWRYPKEVMRLVARGEQPLPAGLYTLDPAQAFLNFSWGRLEFSLRHLVPLKGAASSVKAAA